MANKLPFRKIRVWALYDPSTKTAEFYHFKFQVPKPRRGSGLHVVEMTGFYPSITKGNENG